MVMFGHFDLSFVISTLGRNLLFDNGESFLVSLEMTNTFSCEWVQSFYVGFRPRRRGPFASAKGPKTISARARSRGAASAAASKAPKAGKGALLGL